MINSKLIIGDDVTKNLKYYFNSTFENKIPYIIADTNTYPLLEQDLKLNFPDSQVHIFGGETLYADDKNVNILVSLLNSNLDYRFLAVGSGTINDLCKRASFLCNNRQYICVATAPSVDGYTSNGAALTIQGLKITEKAPAPCLVVANTNILCDAPSKMIAAGYGDLLAKIPAGADWILAASLNIEPIDNAVWDIVQKPLRNQLSNPEKLAVRNKESIQKLFSGLINTGFAMQEYFDSRPASGAEHLLSHVWEMNGCCEINNKPVSHGFKVSIGTLITTAIFEELLKLNKEDLRSFVQKATIETWEQRVKTIKTVVENDSVKDRQIEICKSKFLEIKDLRARQLLAISNWDNIKAKIKEQIFTFKEISNSLKAAGAPTEPADIGLSLKNLKKGLITAQMMRNRYTCLDFLYEFGIIEDMFNRIKPYFSRYNEDI